MGDWTCPTQVNFGDRQGRILMLYLNILWIRLVMCFWIMGCLNTIKNLSISTLRTPSAAVSGADFWFHHGTFPFKPFPHSAAPVIFRSHYMEELHVWAQKVRRIWSGHLHWFCQISNTKTMSNWTRLSIETIRTWFFRGCPHFRW